MLRIINHYLCGIQITYTNQLQMKRIIAFFAIVLLMAATSAGVVSLQKDTRLPEVCTTPAVTSHAGSSMQIQHCERPTTTQSADDTDANWTDWTLFGKASFPEGTFATMEIVSENDGFPWPEWDEPFSVMRRHNADNPNQVQFRLDKIFNGVDIIVDMDATTNAIAINAQTTGISNPHYYVDNAYTEFMIWAQQLGGVYYPEAGKFLIYNLWIWVAPALGYNLGPCQIVLDVDSALEFSMSRSSDVRFYSASEDKATFIVSRTPEVKSYRVVVYRFTTQGVPIGFFDSNPTVTYPYIDYTAPSFEVELGDSPVYTVFAIPLGSDGSAIAPYVKDVIYSNRHEQQEWIPIGECSLTDVVGFIAVPHDNREIFDDQHKLKVPAATRAVQVDVRSDNPSIFRIHNPFGKDYPYYNKMKPTATDGEDFYMIVDATDPSRVKIPATLAGIDDEDTCPAVIQCNYSEYSDYQYGDEASYDESYGNYWGKYSDARISFPSNSVRLSGRISTCSDAADIELQLPGFVDYSISGENDGLPDDDDIYTLSVSDNVYSVSCALVSEEQYLANKYFPERLCRLVTDGDAGLLIKNYVVNGSLVEIPASELVGEYFPDGCYYLVAVPYDANNVSHAGIVSRHPISKGEWTPFRRIGAADEYAIVSISALSIEPKHVSAYISKSRISKRERIQVGDFDCYLLNDNRVTWTSYFNNSNVTIVREGEYWDSNCNIYTCYMPSVETGYTWNGKSLMCCDAYTYLTQVQPGSSLQGYTSEDLINESYIDTATGLISILCVYYTDESLFLCQESMQLTGYVSEYDLELDYTGEFSENAQGQFQAVVEASRSEDVAYFVMENKRGIIRDMLLNKLYDNLVADEDATRYTAGTEEITVDAFRGYNTIIGVGYDSAGRVVCKRCSYFRISPDEDNWRPAGSCVYTDGIILSQNYYWSDDIVVGGETWTVGIEADITTSGRYRLVNPYYTWPLNVEFYREMSLPGDYYIVFNASNPNRVYVEESELGLTIVSQLGPLAISSMAYQAIEDGESMDAIAEAGYFGTNSDGIITFPGWSLLFGAYDTGYNGSYTWNCADGDPDMEFPGASNVPVGTGKTVIDIRNADITQVEIDAIVNDGPAKYFNLQGIPVANPSGGIFIEVRGNKASKRYIP